MPENVGGKTGFFRHACIRTKPLVHNACKTIGSISGIDIIPPNNKPAKECHYVTSYFC